MQKETVRTLGQIKNLMEQQNQYKRFICSSRVWKD